MISKSIIHRLFVNRVGSIYRFTSKVTFCSLAGAPCSRLEVSIKGTTSLLSLKVGRSEFRLAPHVPSHSPSLTPKMGGLLSRRTQATLTHANLRIIPNKQKFIVSSRLRSSYLGHWMKKSVSTVNSIIKWEWVSSWSDLMQYSLHMCPRGVKERDTNGSSQLANCHAPRRY